MNKTITKKLAVMAAVANLTIGDVKPLADATCREKGAVEDGAKARKALFAKVHKLTLAQLAKLLAAGLKVQIQEYCLSRPGGKVAVDDKGNVRGLNYARSVCSRLRAMCKDAPDRSKGESFPWAKLADSGMSEAFKDVRAGLVEYLANYRVHGAGIAKEVMQQILCATVRELRG